MIKSFVFLAAVIAASEAVCPVFETAANIDLGSFSRDWKFQYIGQNSSTSPGLECVHGEFHADHTTEAPIPARLHMHGFYTVTGDEFNAKYDGFIPDQSRPGFWLMINGEIPYELSVLYSDERDFALVVECATDPETGTDYYSANFMAKNYSPIPDDVFETMVAILDANDVGFENIFPIPGDDVLCDHH